MPEAAEDGTIIDHTRLLSESLAVLLNESSNTDVIFIVENETFKAHRLILALQSVVFREMLLGSSFRESLQKDAPIPLPDKSAAAFAFLLRYLYTACLDTANFELHVAIEVLLMAHEFQVTNLVRDLSQRLTKRIDLETVSALFEAALVLDVEVLLRQCRNFICQNAKQILEHSSFLELSEPAITEMISCDEFGASEIDILLALSAWSKRNSGANVKHVLEHAVRFELVTVEGLSLASLAPLFNLFSTHKIDIGELAAKYISAPRFRRFLETENQAIPEKGAVVLREGDSVNPYYMIDGSFFKRTANFSIQGFETHHFHGSDSFIMLKLGKVCYVDSLLFVAANFSTSSYVVCPSGFRIETSLDKKNWQVLAENDEYLAIQRRLLVFPARHIQFIKLIGRATKAFHAFYVLHFECPASSAVIDDVKWLYNTECPNGGVLMYELEQKRAIVLDV